MNTYDLHGANVYYSLVEEGLGEPFRLLSAHHSTLLNPWGVTLVDLGEDLTVAQVESLVAMEDDAPVLRQLRSGWLYAAVQYRPRHRPIQLGEFFVPDLMMATYLDEVKRNHELAEETPA